ncbi:MAG TPA: protein tyrosine kinase [Chromatiaceae bacterium]|nr:protein tyrosine kinase [Chromatiaceae bacterium]HIB84530.1 protein tyrosine kinase [Chromatiaceae bacterium]HIN81803.1 protein tyrosine kinase [Chromatiales bacterium]HIO13602.1 protein tyrosine kinase [Chromatiales bacterium]HIO53962.1 protein tyrosine kinase [Chromatiales bacterium]
MSIIEKALDKQGKNKPPEPPELPAVHEEKQAEAGAIIGRAVDGSVNTAQAAASDPVESGLSEPASSNTAGGGGSQRIVTINVRRLEAAGMLTPSTARSQIAEEYRIIKRPLLVNAFGGGAAALGNANLIMVTSAMPGEGKTFCSVNLAMSIAMELERTVLLVDADMAQLSVTKLLGIEAEYGLTDVLRDDNSVRLKDALIRTDVPKLTLLPAGSHYHQSTELLASDAMHRIADELSQRYSDRIVIFDAPPLLAASQASVLAHLMGQVVLVVEAEWTPQHIVGEALLNLGTENVVGVIINKTRQAVGKEYYGYGRYGG